MKAFCISGVDGAIHRVAGPELLEECKQLNGCNTGEAKITKGYGLKANYVIHTVGPHYGEERDAELLHLAYWNTLQVAKENHIHSIAFPAISTGRFSYPKKEAVAIAVETVDAWLRSNVDYPMQIIFSCVDTRIYQYFCEKGKQIFASIPESEC